MRLKINKKTRPKPGDERIVKQFAWLPVEITNTGMAVWLESYWSFQKRRAGGYDELPYWEETETYFKEIVL